MNANLGGFASALIKNPVWVMNLVPVQAKVDTLGAIYEKGVKLVLIEPFITY